ncbi:MAG: S-methyl-5-thioribose kinase [Caldilineaceae bacterium]
MTTPLTSQTAIETIQQTPVYQSVLGGATDLQSKAITEGNINLLFRVNSAADPIGKSVLVKQALDHSWRYPDFKLPESRQAIEYGVLALEARYCPEQAVKVYHYDQVNHILVLEDLNQHLVMREGMMQQQRYPLVAKHVGNFAARTLFYTSDFYLSSAEKKAMVPQFLNPVLCKLQEDLVFTQPCIRHPSNRWTPGLEPQIEAIYADDEIYADMLFLKEQYMTNAQALLHNDLHTGSIMLNQHETKMIDPEFAFFGPIAHDVGSYLANLALGYAAQEAHGKEPAARTAYRAWIAESFVETWNIFHDEFMRLWEDEGIQGEWESSRFRKRYMAQLLQNVAAFGCAEMLRRLIGLAWVQDFTSIPDQRERANAESIGINIAINWLKHRQAVNKIEDLAAMMTEAKSSL